jgi:zinc protease
MKRHTEIRRAILGIALSFVFLALPLATGLTSPGSEPQARASTGAAQQRRRAPAQPPKHSPAAQSKQPAASAPLAEAPPLVNRVLANGLEVIVLADHSIPLVTVELAVRNGSFTEPPELNGLSHLYEHMFFKSNRATRDKEDYLQNIGQRGIVYNGTTREEIVNYYFTTTTPNFSVALRFLRDAVRYPLFDEREFEREKEVVISELDRHLSNPYGAVTEEMNKRLFYQQPSRKNPGGSPQTVRAATTGQMRLIQSRYYVPNNSAVVITGDVIPAEAFRLAEELFGDWPRAEDPFSKYPLVEHPLLRESEGAVLTAPVSNVILHLGWHGPSIGQDDAATYAADVFSFILRQPGSRFQRELVDTGLVTAVNLNYYTQRNVGPISLIAQTTPDKARAAVRAIHQEIARFNDKDYFTDQQLETAKALLEADELFSREKLSEYTHTISFWWSSTSLDYFRGYLKRLRATSRADISRYITTYIQGQPRVGLALLSSEAQKRAQLSPEELIGERKQTASAAK